LKLALLVTTPPGARSTEALRAALDLARAHEVAVAFVGDGVLSALRSRPDPDLDRLRGRARLLVELESLGAGLAHEAVEPVMRSALFAHFRAAERMVAY
jgi:hypothetical protein